jgi:methionine sulfoxide reductase heme-binding subunit
MKPRDGYTPDSAPRQPWLATVLFGAAAVAGAVWLAAPVPLNQLLRPWYLSRGSGFIALGLLWLSVLIGLLQSCGLLKGWTNAASNIDLHDYLSVLSLYATLFHGLILIFDHYITLSVTDVLVPFATAYKTGTIALGIIALYLGFAATVTTYLRAGLSNRAWRIIHQLSLVGFFMALYHGVAMGSDTRLEPVVYFYLFTGLSVAALTIYRIILAFRKPAPARAREA